MYEIDYNLDLFTSKFVKSHFFCSTVQHIYNSNNQKQFWEFWHVFSKLSIWSKEDITVFENKALHYNERRIPETTHCKQTKRHDIWRKHPSIICSLIIKAPSSIFQSSWKCHKKPWISFCLSGRPPYSKYIFAFLKVCFAHPQVLHFCLCWL